MSTCLFESNWYKLPSELRKLYIIALINAQKPQHYNGFGIIDLNLETFSKVSKVMTVLSLKTEFISYNYRF